jgi:benzodiazapine receptor
MRRRPLVGTVIPVVTAAVLGNALVPQTSHRWFRRLRQPKLAIPFPAFVTVGAVYYVLLGVIRYRAVARDDVAASRLALMVLALNEGWNAVFFGRQSTRSGFFGVLAFTVPVLALQKAVARDRISTLALAPYTIWVLAYDVPWSYRLWRLNP